MTEIVVALIGIVGGIAGTLVTQRLQLKAREADVRRSREESLHPELRSAVAQLSAAASKLTRITQEFVAAIEMAPLTEQAPDVRVAKAEALALYEQMEVHNITIGSVAADDVRGAAASVMKDALALTGGLMQVGVVIMRPDLVDGENFEADYVKRKLDEIRDRATGLTASVEDLGRRTRSSITKV